MKRVKRNYSNEFKQEAVRLSYQRDNLNWGRLPTPKLPYLNI